MMKTLQGAYSNFRPNENPEQARVYAEAFERMVGDFGQGRTSAAVGIAIDLVPDFCPTVAKIREFVPSAGGEHKTCTKCHPSGFVEAAKPKHWLPSSSAPVRPCDHSLGQGPILDVCPDGGHAYGLADIKELWKIHKARQLRLGRTLTEAELNGCLNELDSRIAKLV